MNAEASQATCNHPFAANTIGNFLQLQASMLRWAIATSLMLMTCGLSPSLNGAESAGSRDAHVVLITLDGFPSYMFHDPTASLPALRKLAAEGVVAEGLSVCNPSVTWPNHTTLVSGNTPAKHGVLFNGVLMRDSTNGTVSVDSKKTRDELVKCDTLFEVLHARGLKCAAINWPCTRGTKGLVENFPDTPDSMKHATPNMKEIFKDDPQNPQDKEVSFRQLSGPAKDDIWAEMAAKTIMDHKPQFIAIHFLNTDGTHHRYGARTPASFTAVALADKHVATVLKAIEAAGIKDNTTVIVTADHGFEAPTNHIMPNVALRMAGLLETGVSNKIVKARAQVIPEGGIGMLYLTSPDTREADRKEALAALEGKKGLLSILTPDQYASFGMPLPTQNPGMADYVLVPEPGHSVSGMAGGKSFVTKIKDDGNKGAHGYIATNKMMNAVFIAAGRGVKKGVKTGELRNVDVAPTIAQLLGQKLENVDGTPMKQILE